MLWLIRIAIFALVIYFLAKIITYLRNPKRKLQLAHTEKRYYFYDDSENIRKNFLITYNGVLLEGEKYVRSNETPFDVISIFVWPHDLQLLNTLNYQDILFLEKEVKLKYPNATIDWKSPIKEIGKK
ncbi:sigma-w pathway protein ysdB [Heyndrickxia vini]|uniref:Sigma-w pathway protein ysdB n=1 Tax=Heyndrickxia vini TaxID=1476025 RepID=A0ABX7E5T4_9BACI|nr:sigma-w pathway protein ysdB [Heyndrickxia vini]QQZ10648.1 sigma-w pathway protein ysdB [Heyndrickxia vini]